jgi:hypothetical protein
MHLGFMLWELGHIEWYFATVMRRPPPQPSPGVPGVGERGFFEAKCSWNPRSERRLF